MNNPIPMDDVDFSITLHSYGWTTFLIIHNQHVYTYEVSGAFSDPLNDVADLITALIKQENEFSMHWRGEPGGIVLHFSRIMTARHLLAVEISDIENGKPEVAFQIMQNQLITALFLQLKKIYHLVSEKHYANGRTNEFPFGKYEMLTKLMQEYLPAVVSE